MKIQLAPLALAALVVAMPLASLAQSAPAPTSATSQDQGKRHHGHGHWMKDLQSLDLTADQRAKIDGYMTAFKAANKTADKATRHENMKGLRAQIESVLTPDQQAQLKAKMAAERAAAPKPQ